MKMMKMMKAAKKLKLWTKKKRNKMQRRTSTTTLIISGGGGGDCCPLLPMPWAEIETQTETETETEIEISSSSAYWAPSAAPSAPPLPPWLVLQHGHEDREQGFNFAYPCPQQPREDEAVADLTTFPARGGMFGCAFQLGIHVFRCLCPCFHVRDDPHHHPKLHTN